ncbi:MAG TPA: hypothetical protein VI541_04680, partial [Actinomycetota bacterium]|nr:hypothetical protein [Actinomycetota bacterium]
MRSRIVSLFVVLALGAMGALRANEGPAETLPPSVPVGFAIAPQATVPGAASISISPNGSKLYVASYAGLVLTYPLTAGVVTGSPTTFLSGLSSPLGVLATDIGAYVATNGPTSVTYNSISYVEGIISFAR